MDDKKSNGGRLAMAAARIAKGAATGGPAGAAKEAALSFLPELLKTGVVIIVLLLFIPLLVFVAIPNIVFGYDNAAYTDIVDLTDRAYYIDAAYKRIDEYTLSHIDSIVESIQSENSGEGDFAEVMVDADVSSTNIYWFIAINSVAYQQDLYKMDEDTIMQMLIKKITYTFSIESIIDLVIQEDGTETEVEIRSLKVDIKDLNPEALMDKLDFTDEEKNWARLLHSTLEYEDPLQLGHKGGYTIPPEALTDERFAAMIAEAEKYLGYPYVYGGSTPTTSFDCSGYVCWVINKSGIASVGRTTAQGLYDSYCTPIDVADLQPGDLLFFHNTYNHYEHITHVGIYVGEDMMLHAGNPIGYVNYVSRYGASLFCAAGRIN